MCAAVVQLGGLAWDRWNHVVFVVNGITGSVSTYVNGEFVSKVGGGGPHRQREEEEAVIRLPPS